ncbi:uncharacterized protein LOC113465206 [Ceratina calcarata]|uniref:Uncharacterized protein LOC113465206 n=1 Tax=Ceratina calcarata TaxID=156304 RepID=A0AAJ7WGG4_9HYME|nr:uncharacterized protein LOC113465206 [Ceratina calcarata]
MTHCMIVYRELRQDKLVDHIRLVFMLRGVSKKWKQTICYTFSKGPAKSENIKRLLKEIIEKLNGSHGFKIVAIVCDQGSNRQIYLRNEQEPRRRILIANSEIVPLYDVPHLLKGIRNNLLKKNLIWITHEGRVEAKWDDVVTAYKIDLSSGRLRRLPRITEGHVIPDKINKMKVIHAARILSYSMALAITYMAQHNESDSSGLYTMRTTAFGTGEIINFFDELFDSINGNTLRDPRGCVGPDGRFAPRDLRWGTGYHRPRGLSHTGSRQ